MVERLFRRGDEHDLREIEGHLDVVVREREVLLGIEGFEQGRRGIAPVVAAQFIDLVEHEHGIVGAHRFQGLDDPARHGPDVGAAMPPDLGLVADAA